MVFKEEKRNLFEVDEKYQLPFCISADGAMGTNSKGQAVPCIALEMVKKFPELEALRGNKYNRVGECNWVDRTLAIVTKEKYWHKPTYDTMRDALLAMRGLCYQEDIKFIATYRLGCKLDKLEWPKVRALIQEIFQDMDIEILICY